MQIHEISVNFNETSKRGYLEKYFLKLKPLLESRRTLSNMHYGAFLRKYLTAAKVSSRVLIAILNMHFFVRMNLECIRTGLACHDKKSSKIMK